MRIKEVCERTGLTDRAIRLYMESGLVSPKQETNYMGRRSYIFSEEDVRVLEAVATLRRADFSIADIVHMQASAESLPRIVSEHRQRLAEEIATKENILRTLHQYDSGAQKDYFDLATAISSSASRNSIPKEDSRMNLKDLKCMLQKRIPALIALVLLLVALFAVTSLAIKTAFAEVGLQPGGGFTMDYHWSMAAAMEHALPLLSAFLLLCGVVALIVYLAGGKRYWLIVTGALCTVAMACLALMPAKQATDMYFFEFLFFRYNFHWLPFFHDVPEFMFKAMKYVLVTSGIALTVVGYVLDKPTEEQ